MGLHMSDWKWACIAAVCLLGMAAFVVFVIHPGGFEGQGAWFLVLLLGSIPAMLLSEGVYKLVPSVEPVIYWTLIIVFNYGWYLGISYLMIRIFRGRWQLGSPEF